MSASALIWRALNQFEAQILEPWPELHKPASAPTSVLTPRQRGKDQPGSLLQEPPHQLSRARAIRLLHFPEKEGDAELARRRLALDEFTELQRQIQLRLCKG